MSRGKKTKMDEPKQVFGDIDSTREEMENLMRQVFGPTMPLLRATECKWHPNVDVYESEESVVIVVELAGVARDEVSVVFNGGKLHVSGIRRDSVPHRNRRYCQMEISYNQFERIIYLPKNVDVGKISAKINNGLMIVEAPKKNPDQPKSHQISIG
jgi:HSP20 family protein